MHSRYAPILADAGARIAAWSRQHRPMTRTSPPREWFAPAGTPLGIVARTYSQVRGVPIGDAEETVKAALGITMMGIDVDLTSFDPPAQAGGDFATALFLHKINIAVAMLVAVAESGGAGPAAITGLIARIADSTAMSAFVDPFDEAYPGAFIAELTAGGATLGTDDTAARLAKELAAALERIAAATSIEAASAAWIEAPVAQGRVTRFAR